MFESIHEMRRKAPFHYMAKAYNAYYCAFVLSNSTEEILSQHALAVKYNLTPSVAAHEGFCREASFALESVIKAVIAMKIQWNVAPDGVTRVRPTHALDQLWRDAQLPSPTRDQMFFLLTAKRILFWAGRYAAPIKDVHHELEEAEIRKYDNFIMSGNIKIRRGRPFTWQIFVDLYEAASTEFWRVHAKHDPSQP